MRAVVQRVTEARVRVEDEVVGEIGPGLCVLLGVGRGDDEATAKRLAGRIARLRIFENEEGKFDRSVLDTGGVVLVSASSRWSPTRRRATGRAFRKPLRPSLRSRSTKPSVRRSGNSTFRSRRVSLGLA